MLSSSVMIRRFCSFSITASSSSAPSTITSNSKKKRLVFLGSPQVSASVLDSLFNASAPKIRYLRSQLLLRNHPPEGIEEEK